MYSVMIYNILGPEWISVIKTTVVLLAVDSVGPLLLFGVVWLALDIQTVLRETKGKINEKRRFVGLILLLLVLFPVPTYVGARTLGIERGVEGKIRSALPTDWSIQKVRMSYIWSPIGASGVVFVTYPTESYTKKDSDWYLAGINFYVIQGKKIVDVEKGWINNISAVYMIILQFTTWLKTQKIAVTQIKIISFNTTGRETINNTLYIKLDMLLSIHTKEGEDIALRVYCFATTVKEISRDVAIICYAKSENFEKIEEDFYAILSSFSWV